MKDAWVVALALCTSAGAAVSWPLPVWVGVVVVGGGFLFRRPAVLCLGAALLAAGLGARAWAGVSSPVTSGPSAGIATLLSDPVATAPTGAVRVELRLDGRRLQAWAKGDGAVALRLLLAGERVVVSGRLRPIEGRIRPHLARRHIAARLDIVRVGEAVPGHVAARLANGVRRTLVDGAASLSPRDRALFTGFVLGDDRGQEARTVEDFRAAGLSHLLAVSGQNVAFVLALAAPVLRGLGLWSRLIAGVGILMGFGVLTRWEPSVLRATAMAAIALLATTMGRPATTLRLLALAVTLLLLVDPMLVGSIGFLLSCGACTGIATFTGLVHRRLPVPLPVAVTLAAQVGVAPILLPVFGAVPLVALPANLLALPAAGPIMVWGLVAGLPAGLIGGDVATVLHWPTRVLIGWVAGVARCAAALPVPQARVSHVVVVAACVALALIVRSVRGVIADAAGGRARRL